MKKVFLILAVGVLLINSAFAHSGRTDSNGGHTNHSTGEYHYHHGQPAHQHPNGVCPYDYVDAAEHKSGSSSQSGSASPTQMQPEHSSAASSRKDAGIKFRDIVSIVIIAACLIFLTPFGLFLYIGFITLRDWFKSKR